MRAKLASLGAQFERLSGREQLMVLMIVTGILTFVFSVGGFVVRRDLANREQRIAAKTEKLKELAGLKGDYQRRLAEQNHLAEELRTNNPMRLLSYIEDISKKSGVDISGLSDRQGDTPASEVLREEAAEVQVKNVSIDRLYNFLHMVEEGNRLVRIRRLNIKTEFANPKRLDATVTIGTFKTSEGHAPG